MYIFYRLNDKERAKGSDQFSFLFFNMYIHYLFTFPSSLYSTPIFSAFDRKMKGKGEMMDTPPPHLLFTRRHYFLGRKRILSLLLLENWIEHNIIYGQRNTSIEDFFYTCSSLETCPPSLLRKGRIAW